MSYNIANSKLSESQISKLRSAVENDTDVTLRLSIKNFGKDEKEYPHKLLLTNNQVKKLRNSNNARDIKFSKTQLKKMQSGGFLGSLLKLAMPLAKNVLMPLAKNVLMPLGLTAAASAADAGIQKKILGSGADKVDNTDKTTTLLITNADVDKVLELIKHLEDSDCLIKGATDTIKDQIKNQSGGFLPMLLGTLGASLLGSLLSGKGIIRAGEGIVRAGENFR